MFPLVPIEKYTKKQKTLKQFIWLTPLIASFLSGCVTKLDESYPPTKRAEFMLSFDDGPLPVSTERVLDILTTLKAIDGTPVKAGFFLLADAPDEFWQRRVYYAPYELWISKGSIAKYPNVARRIKRAGHTIGNHTTHHSWFRGPWLDTKESVLNEITEWEAISKRVLGESNTRLFRPPYFILTQNVLEATSRLGYQVVMGESVGDTIPFMTLDEIKEKTESILAEWDKPYPCVLTFHDNRPITYGHLDEIVSNLQRQGFRLVHFDPQRL
jgi:peptidoglycan/xylan/chitin deacetylase (PgdA/CDA1 family)